MKGITGSPDKWLNELGAQLEMVRTWLLDPKNVDETLDSIAEVLIKKHHDYGESNLLEFGELGILVRASDKVARLKNLADKEARVQDESKRDSWRDMAGYAVQALILTNRANRTEKVNTFEVRKKRLMDGHCPDCGKGVLLRQPMWSENTVCLYCSQDCGFTAFADVFSINMNLDEVIRCLALRAACMVQM